MTTNTKNRYGIIGMAIALFVLSAFSLSVSAQPTRTDVPVAGLFNLITNRPTAGEIVTFSVSSGAFALLDLHPSEIIAVEWEFGDVSMIRSKTLYMTTHTYSEPGAYTVTLRIVTAMFNIVSTENLVVQLALVANPANISTMAAQLNQFDFNRDNFLNDSDFFNIVDAWISSRISDAVFFAGVDTWIAGAKISSNTDASARRIVGTSSAVQAVAQMTHFGVIFATQGTNVENLTVKVFNSNGSLIFSQKINGNRLTWNLLSTNGSPLANGLYLYILETSSPDGKLSQSNPQMIAVIR